MSVEACFASSYQEARGKFLMAAQHQQLAQAEYLHPETGRDGEPLALDVALAGDPAANRLLIISSACHGIEGYCGSGAQIALINSPDWRAAMPPDCAVLYLHALNPYGFSWWRRTTHENIDLNRNCHDFSQPLPANPGYDRLAGLMLPATWPPSPANWLRLLGAGLRLGSLRALQGAISTGQFSHPNGLFYGGQAESWSLQTIKSVLRRYAGHRSCVAWIDIHSGLGPTGVGERIFACDYTAANIQRARAWWGDGVKSSAEGNSVSMVTGGQLWQSFYQACPGVQYTGLGLEFGTQPLWKVLHALRGDHWLALHPEASPALQQSIRRKMFEAFFCNTGAWQEAVVAQSKEAASQALWGLAQMV